MDINSILDQLREERELLEEAILALERLATRGKRRGRPPAWMVEAKKRGRPASIKSGKASTGGLSE